MRKTSEIYDQIDRANGHIEEGTGLAGMSYEEGVKAALEWMMDDNMPEPIEED